MPAVILSTLAVVLAASVWVFWTLVRNETSHKRQAELAYWAAQNHMRLENPRRKRWPPVLEELAQSLPPARWVIGDANTTLVRLQGPQGAGWNLLVRRLAIAQAGAALRPTKATAGLLNKLGFESFPLLLESDRFVACGVDSAAARQLARAPMAGLLPADIGLILWRSALILDFSSRPFDALGLSRITALADQIAARLPASCALPV